MSASLGDVQYMKTLRAYEAVETDVRNLYKRARMFHTPDVVKLLSERYSPGKQGVRMSIWEVLEELNIKYKWRGNGINEKCYDKNGNCIVACDKEYFRPLEVDTLLGNSNKAMKELKWKPKTSIKSLVKEMVNFDLKKLVHD